MPGATTCWSWSNWREAYQGAIVLVTHDAGAVTALKPERAILLPDGDEDAWSDDLLELVELA